MSACRLRGSHISLFLTKSALSTKLLSLTTLVHFLLAVSQISQNQNFRIKPIFSEKCFFLCIFLSQRHHCQLSYLIEEPSSHPVFLFSHLTHLTGDQILQTQTLSYLSTSLLPSFQKYIWSRADWIGQGNEREERFLKWLPNIYIYSAFVLQSWGRISFLGDVFAFVSFQLTGWGPPRVQSLISFTYSRLTVDVNYISKIPRLVFD